MRHAILILDDEERICETLADYLVDMGHHVVSCGDGAAALEELRANNFTLAIVDLRLPSIDGNTFIKQANLLRPELRYIIHTGSLEYASGNVEQEHVGGRIMAVLSKPVERMQVFSDILDIIGRAE